MGIGNRSTRVQPLMYIAEWRTTKHKCVNDIECRNWQILPFTIATNLPQSEIQSRQGKIQAFKYRSTFFNIPHKPSFTLEEGIFLGLNPAFVQ